MTPIDTETGPAFLASKQITPGVDLLLCMQQLERYHASLRAGFERNASDELAALKLFAQNVVNSVNELPDPMSVRAEVAVYPSTFDEPLTLNPSRDL